MPSEITVALITLSGVIVTPFIGVWVAKLSRKSVDAPKLEHHPLKRRLQDLITYLRTTYRVSTPGRTFLSRDHLVYKIETGSAILEELEKAVDTCFSACSASECNGCNKLYNMNLKALDDIVVAYNSFPVSQTFNHEEMVAIAIYMPKFNVWHNPRVEKIKDIIQTVCSSEYYRGAGCNIRQAIILDHYVAEYSGAVKDAEDVMSKINGELTGKVYRGEIM